MNTTTAGYLVVFGIFTALLGVMGYMTHPERAITALIFGGGCGALWMLWGILGAKGIRWSWPAAVATTALFAIACAWRAGVSWLAVAGGQPEKAFASVLITLTLAVSAVMLVFLLRGRETPNWEKPTGGAQ